MVEPVGLDMKVTLIHEWLTSWAGSERCVAALRRLFPGAPVCTSMVWRPAFPDWDPVIASFAQRLARSPDAHVRALPILPMAFRSLKLPAADLYVTSFHTFALHARVPDDAPHLVYCYTPPRFIYGREQLGGEAGIRGWLMGAAASRMRSVDQARTRRRLRFVGISRAISRRIRDAYQVDADVVYPPVDVERFMASKNHPDGDYFLVLSRLVPYKRIDLALAAFAELGLPLLVAGQGRAEKQLRASAPRNVKFLGRVPDEELPALMAGARALIFPGEEDFGIAPVEAMAAGTPVIAFGSGGVCETVEDGRSGVLFSEQSSAALVAAVRRAATIEWDADDISAGARRFEEHRYAVEMRALALDTVNLAKT